MTDHLNELIKGELLEQYGFESNIDYDKDFPSDKHYTIKFVTYKKNIVEDLWIYVTDEFDFVNHPDEWKYKNTYVEICLDREYQKIKITSMWQLTSLMNLLQGNAEIQVFKK